MPSESYNVFICNFNEQSSPLLLFFFKSIYMKAHIFLRWCNARCVPFVFFRAFHRLGSRRKKFKKFGGEIKIKINSWASHSFSFGNAHLFLSSAQLLILYNLSRFCRALECFGAKYKNHYST